MGKLIFPDPVEPAPDPKYMRQNLDESGWKNIRIKLNYSYITGELHNPLSCYEVGQIIDLGKDIINLTIIINNHIEFAEKFLKIISIPNKDYDLEYIVKITRYPSDSSI